MNVRLISTEGFALPAEIEVNGEHLRVMDMISLPDSRCQPGPLSNIRIDALEICFDSSQEAFSGNPERKKQFESIHGWDYLGYGQILSINPLQIDFGVVQLQTSPFTHDARCVGEFVVVRVNRLEISQIDGQNR